MGPDCTEFSFFVVVVLFCCFGFLGFFVLFLFFKSSCHLARISFLLYQSSDIAMVSWWAGTSLLRSLLVRQVAVGPWGQREHQHWFLCSVRKPNQVICIAPKKKMQAPLPPPKRARAAFRAQLAA